ncbi:hypothetical protein AAFF_G00324270 [Aldrovandia affinis]|uniref:Uncharacterized protein n=1 Tax=Aldrovandia affinis TaxID=143900 RepID=A0AAD7R6Z1_9TELE|nr:hypothetical protein AAFF_G00324270 [Aldrovandia affinis]
MSELSSLMVNTDELSCLKTEFSSVAKLIHELILRQSELASKLRLAGERQWKAGHLIKRSLPAPGQRCQVAGTDDSPCPPSSIPWMRTTSQSSSSTASIHFRDGMNVEKSCCHILWARILHHQDQGHPMLR